MATEDNSSDSSSKKAPRVSPYHTPEARAARKAARGGTATPRDPTDREWRGETPAPPPPTVKGEYPQAIDPNIYYKGSPGTAVRTTIGGVTYETRITESGLAYKTISGGGVTTSTRYYDPSRETIILTPGEPRQDLTAERQRQLIKQQEQVRVAKAVEQEQRSQRLDMAVLQSVLRSDTIQGTRAPPPPETDLALYPAASTLTMTRISPWTKLKEKVGITKARQTMKDLGTRYRGLYAGYGEKAAFEYREGSKAKALVFTAAGQLDPITVGSMLVGGAGVGALARISPTAAKVVTTGALAASAPTIGREYTEAYAKAGPYGVAGKGLIDVGLIASAGKMARIVAGKQPGPFTRQIQKKIGEKKLFQVRYAKRVQVAETVKKTPEKQVTIDYIGKPVKSKVTPRLRKRPVDILFKERRTIKRGPYQLENIELVGKAKVKLPVQKQGLESFKLTVSERAVKESTLVFDEKGVIIPAFPLKGKAPVTVYKPVRVAPSLRRTDKSVLKVITREPAYVAKVIKKPPTVVKGYTRKLERRTGVQLLETPKAKGEIQAIRLITGKPVPPTPKPAKVEIIKPVKRDKAFDTLRDIMREEKLRPRGYIKGPVAIYKEKGVLKYAEVKEPSPIHKLALKRFEESKAPKVAAKSEARGRQIVKETKAFTARALPIVGVEQKTDFPLFIVELPETAEKVLPQYAPAIRPGISTKPEVQVKARPRVEIKAAQELEPKQEVRYKAATIPISRIISRPIIRFRAAARPKLKVGTKAQVKQVSKIKQLSKIKTGQEMKLDIPKAPPPRRPFPAFFSMGRIKLPPKVTPRPRLRKRRIKKPKPALFTFVPYSDPLSLFLTEMKLGRRATQPADVPEERRRYRKLMRGEILRIPTIEMMKGMVKIPKII